MVSRIWGIIAVAMLVCGAENVRAQQFSDAENGEMLAKPVSLLEEDNSGTETVDLEAFDPEISYYVQNLNLSPDQLDQAQRISEAEQIKKEDLLRQIEALRREAYNLEAGSLIAFEAILDDAQKATFQELRAGVKAEASETTEDDIDKLLNN
jgi:hypothetical protein